IQCMSNHRQLGLAWRMYAEENRDLIVYASDNYDPALDQYAWTLSYMDFNPNNPANWDPNVDLYLRPLWPYCGKNLGIYKCPADRSTVTLTTGQPKPRTRSMSMNAFMGGFDGEIPSMFASAQGFLCFTKLSQITAAPNGPANYWLFLDMR